LGRERDRPIDVAAAHGRPLAGGQVDRPLDSVVKIGNQAPSTVIDTGTASPDGALFRFTSGGTWMNNLSTKGWSPGNYLITLEFADGRLYRAMVALR